MRDTRTVAGSEPTITLSRHFSASDHRLATPQNVNIRDLDALINQALSNTESQVFTKAPTGWTPGKAVASLFKRTDRQGGSAPRRLKSTERASEVMKRIITLQRVCLRVTSRALDLATSCVLFTRPLPYCSGRLVRNRFRSASDENGTHDPECFTTELSRALLDGFAPRAANGQFQDETGRDCVRRSFPGSRPAFCHSLTDRSCFSSVQLPVSPA